MHLLHSLLLGFFPHWINQLHVDRLWWPETGRPYAFNSSIGGNLTSLGVFWGLWRHFNCHVTRCPRLGRPVAGTHHRACRTHHPHAGQLTAAHIAEAHRRHVQLGPGPP